MKAIILAAGRGSRLNELTQNKPKCLTKIGSLSLLERQIASITAAGINDISIVTGYLSEELSDVNITKYHNQDWQSTNMVMSLMEADNLLTNDECIISYSDIFYETNAISMLMKSNFKTAITYDPQWLKKWSQRYENPLEDAETFRILNNQLLIEIGNKPNSIEEVDGQFMGLIKISPGEWIKIKNYFYKQDAQIRKQIQLTHLLNGLIQNQIIEIAGIPFTGIWGEIDTKKDLEFYEKYYKKVFKK